LKITISHPHGSIFSYHAARALSEKNWLGTFQTGVTGSSAIAKLSSLLLGDSKQRLRNRDFDNIPREKQRSHISWEAVSRAGKRLRSRGPTAEINWYDVLFSGHDWRVSRLLETKLDAVYTYEDGAKLTFEAAKRRSIAKIYELPLGYYRGVASEMERARKTTPHIDLQIKQEPPWKQARKDSELELADLVIVPCEWARSTLPVSKFPHTRVIKVPYGTPADEVSVRDQKPDGPFTVLFAGQIGVRKGVPLLLEAWKRLGLKNARLLMAGSLGLDEKSLKSHNGFRYLGALPRVRLLEVMKEVDLFVFPSLAEGFGLVIGEAMAAGVPVLTTMNTGGPEMITDGQEGWCVPAHDVDSLAERIEWAYWNRDAVYEMGSQARRRAERWTWADYRKKLTDELSQHLGIHPVAPLATEKIANK
jgi:glycosyltransferase involved in cell wall biosynthesis